MLKYRLISKKGEGTFSEVLKAQSIKTNRYVAIKCMKNKFESVEQVNTLREIQALRRLSPHPHIIKLYEVVYDQQSGRLALVFELMDMNMYEAIRGRRQFIQESKVKFYMWQLLKAMDHMHRNGIFHRDIKPENILMVNDQIKLADFGSCRGIYSKQPYTEYISTRWYRAPECLLTDGYYNYKMDMWGVGCVFYEIMTLMPLFPGTNEADQIKRIHAVLGTPPEEILQKFKQQASHIDFEFTPCKGTGIARNLTHASPLCVDLITKLLEYNPDDRISARQALKHEYFADLREAEKITAEQSAHQVSSTPDQHHNTNQHTVESAVVSQTITSARTSAANHVDVVVPSINVPQNNNHANNAVQGNSGLLPTIKRLAGSNQSGANQQSSSGNNQLYPSPSSLPPIRQGANITTRTPQGSQPSFTTQSKTINGLLASKVGQSVMAMAASHNKPKTGGSGVSETSALSSNNMHTLTGHASSNNNNQNHNKARGANAPNIYNNEMLTASASSVRSHNSSVIKKTNGAVIKPKVGV